MGYHTDFVGEFKIEPALKPEHLKYLQVFNRVRHMKRDPEQAAQIDDPIRKAVGLPLGEEGEFFVGHEDGNFGQNRIGGVIDYNSPPSSQPGLWCQWIPTEDGQYLVWDEGEKFYHYIEWLQYMIDKFFIPWGYTLNGKIDWEGEQSGDIGRIKVTDNNIYVAEFDLYELGEVLEQKLKPLSK